MNNAIKLGASKYLTTAFGVNTVNAFSVVVWVKCTVDNTGTDQVIIQQVDNNGTGRGWLTRSDVV